MEMPGLSKMVQNRKPTHQTGTHDFSKQNSTHTHACTSKHAHMHTSFGTITGSYMTIWKATEQWGKYHLDILVVVQIITKKLCKQLRYKCLVSPGTKRTQFLQPRLCVDSSWSFGFSICILYTSSTTPLFFFSSCFLIETPQLSQRTASPSPLHSPGQAPIHLRDRRPSPSPYFPAPWPSLQHCLNCGPPIHMSHLEGFLECAWHVLQSHLWLSPSIKWTDRRR